MKECIFAFLLFGGAAVTCFYQAIQERERATIFCSEEFEETRYESETNLSRDQYVFECLAEDKQF